MALTMEPAFASNCVFDPVQTHAYWEYVHPARICVPLTCGLDAGFAGGPFVATVGTSGSWSSACSRPSRGANRRRQGAVGSKSMEAKTWPTTSNSSTTAAPPATPAAAEQQSILARTSPEVVAEDSSEVLTAVRKPVGSRRWADIELDEDDDLDVVEEEESVPLVGRAAKRQRQRLRRRLGRVEAAAVRLAGRSASADGSQSSSSSGGSTRHPPKAIKHGNEEGSEATTALEKKEMIMEPSSLAVPKAAFTTTPEFERFRVAYRSFRLGNAAGAKGEVSDTASPDVSQKCPIQRLNFWSALLKALNLCVVHA